MKKKILITCLSVLLALAMLFTCACAPKGKTVSEALAELDADASNVSLSKRDATGKNGVVVSASPYASKAGMAVLEAGGNAFDAAVAVAFALGVVEPYASGVGGGGIMVGYQKSSGKFFNYNFREFTPALGTKAYYEEVSGKPGDATVLDNGILGVGVPTEVAGLCKIVDDLGVLKLEEVLYPAIHYAENGFEVTPTLFENLYDKLESVAGADVFFGEYGKLQVGDKLVQANYAKTLKEIAAKGKDGFYTGWVAEAIIKAMQEHGGIITMEDLKYASDNYPVVCEPTVGSYQNKKDTYSIISSSSPSSGGTILVEAMNMLEYYQRSTGKYLADMDRDSVEYIHTMASAQQYAYGDKTKYFGDFNFVNVPAGLITKEYAAARWDACFSADKAYDYSGAGQTYYGSGATDPWNFSDEKRTVDLIGENEDDHGTTAFTVVDKDGNVASFTQTINHFWGAYIIPEGTGFFLNNQMSSATYTAGGSSEVKPYKQPTSHIMPTFVLDSNNNPVIALGSPGSMRLVSAVYTTILNVLEFDMDIQNAIDYSRIYNYGNTKTSGKKKIETECLSAETIAALEAMGYYVDNYDSINLYFGGVHGVVFHYDAKGNLINMSGGADSRRDGKALAY